MVASNWKRFQTVGIMLSMIILIAAVSAKSKASEEPLCVKLSKPCMRDTDCCNGCCFKEKCVSHADYCVKENNPCYLHECPPNTVCYLQKVQCFRAPCYPIPTCRPLNDDYD